ncbi:MAG: hypothetical protein K0Q62_482 [Phenylobacterium sp.]|nr:hypothetical protein [Phenylobacterium sp.]
MTQFKLLAASALGACLLAAPVSAAAQAQAAAPAASTTPAAVDPAALKALEVMGAYLRTLTSFEMKADILADEVTADGRKLQIGSTVTYKARKPSQLAIDTVSDRKLRKLYYDGKQLTLYAPRNGYYAQASAPPTIRETLDVLNEKYGVEVPLEDLFRWGEPGDSRDALTRGFYVGPARIGGVETDQYAYSTGDVDWQVWITRGDKPVPRKIVITSLFDDAQPQFSATMDWNTAPSLKDADFTFTPPADAKSITFANASTAATK